MKTPENLLRLLGIKNYTTRHLRIINDFLSADKTDAKELLDQLGRWDENDLNITEKFLKI